MLKTPDESIKDETAGRVNSLSVVPVSVATYSLRLQVAPSTLTLVYAKDELSVKHLLENSIVFDNCTIKWSASDNYMTFLNMTLFLIRTRRYNSVLIENR